MTDREIVRPIRGGRGADRSGGREVITGGAGFVGTNLARRLLECGRRVRVLDDLSRDGVEGNLAFLRERFGGDRLDVLIGDVRDPATVADALRDARHVYHLAAQVAVTNSLLEPRHDFEVNVLGTLNVLEAARDRPEPPSVLFTSTNKVYGDLCDLPLSRNGSRYRPDESGIGGIDESRALDFHSPYGCSKGAADQYVLDYARSYGLRAAVFRMSCIYGPHQFGTEDQGWVAHFLIQALEGRPIVLYGDGRQVRDVLYVDDLVDAFLLARNRMEAVAGRAFNIGGGPTRTTSLLELVDRIERLDGRRPVVRFADWRTGDQRWYVSNPAAFGAATGWTPRTPVDEGVARLYRWLRQNRTGAAEPDGAPARIETGT